MLSEKIISMTNDQIKKELESAYLYLGIANYYEENNLCGFANWFKVQAKEEVHHAMLFSQYLFQNQTCVKLYPLEAPKLKFSDFNKPLMDSLLHEQFITNSINKIYDEADSENDIRTKTFLSWFIKEQQEEETNADCLIQKMKLYGKSACGLYALNKELKERKF